MMIDGTEGAVDMQMKVEVEDETSEMDVADITFFKDPGDKLWVDFHVITQHKVLGHIRIPVDQIVRITEA
jgi:hypothetical protein